MNRIYKVVWNEARNCYVVASELAKKQTKGGGKKMLAALLAAGIFSVTGAGSAWADNVVVDASNETGKNTVTAGSQVTLVGTGNEVNGSDNNEVFGNGNKILIADMGSQNVGIFGALNTVTDADTMYVTGYQNTAKSIFTSSLMGWHNTLDTVVSGAVHGNQNKISKVKDVDVLGSDNTVVGVMPTDPSAFVGTVVIVGDSNKLDKSTFSSVIGWENTVENSKSQIIMGDGNTIKNRNAGTVSGKQEARTKNVLDITIGKGNDISGNDTYMKGHESLKVIGDHNSFTNPSAGIVIGDYQNLGAIKESVIIGSMSPEEKADTTIQQKHKSVVIGYHAQSGVETGGGMNVAVGHRAKAYGWMESVTGISSVIENGDTGYDGYLANIYGGLNKISAAPGADGQDGLANSIVGTLNQTSGANGALVMGAGNQITHSYGSAAQTGELYEAIFGMTQYSDSVNYDNLVPGMGIHMMSGSGSVSALGNGNTAEYAIRSQIIGSGNILKGADGTNSENNNVNGYLNTGDKISNVSMIGMGNHVSDSKSDVVIGDYHKVTGGSNNVILGSMAYTERTEDKTYNVINPENGSSSPIHYKVTVYEPVKAHTANISNAVMLGYNTDVTKNGGVALGAESIASTDKGVAGYDPAARAASANTSPTWKATAAAVSVGGGDMADPTGAAGTKVTRQITNLAAGTEDTDAVNVAQLKKLQETVTTTAGEAGKHTTLVAGDYATVAEGTNAAGGKEYTVSGPQLTSADGTVTITDKVENGKKVGYNLSVDTSAISGTVNKGIDFAGDSGSAINKKMGETLEIKGGAAELTDNNIGVVSEGGALKVKLAKNITGVETLTVSEKITVGETTVGKDTVTTKTVETETVKAGDTTINTEGVSIQNGPSITKNNVDMHNQQIHNVQDGSSPTDAATVGQVQKLQQETGKEISRIDNRVDRLDSRVDKVGAGAAALAALHPVDFDADDKVDVAAGWGHYKGQNAMALGAFYRPDERTMFSIGGAFGNGENLINAGVTFKLDKRTGPTHAITSKSALVQEVAELKATNAEMQKQMQAMSEKMEKMEKLLAAK